MMLDDLITDKEIAMRALTLAVAHLFHSDNELVDYKALEALRQCYLEAAEEQLDAEKNNGKNIVYM